MTLPGEAQDLQVTDRPATGRYEAHLNGEPAGFAAYRREDGRIVFTHFEVSPALEGRGIASALARAVLDDAVAAGLAIVPRCSFLRAYIRDNPRYIDAVAPEARPSLDGGR